MPFKVEWETFLCFPGRLENLIRRGRWIDPPDVELPRRFFAETFDLIAAVFYSGILLLKMGF